MRLMILGLLLLLAMSAQANDAALARQDYSLNCEGCHLAGGQGFPGKVPKMDDFVGVFLHSDDGRAFLVQVPGVAFAPLDDASLSRLLNWMVLEFSAPQLPDDFRPYTPDEIAKLRRDPETDPDRRRQEILARLGRPQR